MAGRTILRRRVRVPRFPPLIRAVMGTGVAALACIVALLGPGLSVRAVAWTGNVQLAASRCQALEAASLGQPLYLLPERRLRALLALDPETAEVTFARRWPGTLQVRVTARRAAVVTEDGAAIDHHGRVLERRHALPGLTRIRGFALAADGARLEPEAAALLDRVLDGLARAGIAIRRLERRGDDLLVTLSASDTRLKLSSRAVEAGLRKLALLGPALPAAEYPRRVDLRFRDQIVIEAKRMETRRGRG